MSNSDIIKSEQIDIDINTKNSFNKYFVARNNTNTKVFCKSTCAFVLGIFIILSLGITYIGLSVLSLVNTDNKQVDTICPDSTIWIFVLVSLIINLGNFINCVSTDNDKQINICKNVFGTLISIGIIGWGGYEIWGNRCNIDNLGDKLLFKMAITTVILDMVLVSIVLIAMLYSYASSSSD